MTLFHPPLRVLAWVAGASAVATAGFAQAAGKTPFTPPQAVQQAAAAPAGPTQLEFRAFMDAGDGPQSREPVALALWLAEVMAASGIVVHGDVAVPAGSRVPVERG